MTIRTNQIGTWVFVTGVIRSGTTFLGKILSFPSAVDYIHEPFHGGYTLPDRRVLLPRYVRPGDRSPAVRQFKADVEKLYQYKIGMRTSAYDEDPWHRKAMKAVVGSRGPFFLRLAKLNPLHQAAIIKDPIGKMAAGFLYREFNTTPVILTRHPVSLAASLQRLNWWPEVHEFAVQPTLVEDFFADERDFLMRSWPNRMMESMAHWRATYKVLLSQAQTYGDWEVITHEELSAAPVETTQKLYGALGLPWHTSYKDKLKVLTGGDNSAAAREGRVQDFKRDSARIFEMRRDAIPIEQRREIFDIVQDVALQVYTRESFAID